jgi:AraC family transcriptional regulator
MKDNAVVKPAAGRSSAPASGTTCASRLNEAAVWGRFPNAWRQLYGGLYDVGVSLEWHDFQPPDRFEWSRAFHPGSLELCLNLAGSGCIRCGDRSVEYGALTAGFYVPGKSALQGWRGANERHRFVTLEFSSKFLRGHLGGCDGALHRLAEGFLQGDPVLAGLSDVHPLTAEQEQWIAQLVCPPVFQAARRLWYQGKILQVLAAFMFERPGEDELLCDRQKRLARERAAKVIALLRVNLAEPPSLHELGQRVGCSPFYLSRTFSAEMSMTIPQFLRKLRMERAAELLRSGKFNVTEAALEVGYSSLSHFSQAFCQTMGCCPVLYPLRTPARP